MAIRSSFEHAFLVTQINGQETGMRSTAVDIVKLVAAAAVVWIHVTACEQSRELLPLCRFAVPFFTCAAVYFALHKAQSARNSSLLAYSVQRARRLYLPFLVWGVLYLLVRLLKHHFTGSGSPIVWSPALLLNGSAHHLWFLPFVCVLSIVAFTLSKRFGLPKAQDRGLWSLTFILLGVALALTSCPVTIQPTEVPLTYFVDHAWDALPSAFFGAALFFLLSVIAPDVGLRWGVLFAGVICLGLEFVHDDYLLFPHLAGAAFLFFTVTQPHRPWMEPLQPWAELAFVIYLVHLFFVEGLQMLSDRFGSDTSLPADLSIWALSLVASAIAAKLLLRLRMLAWAFPR